MELICRSTDDNGEKLIDLAEFCGLVDLITYMPKKQEKISSGKLSPEIFRILSSNQRDSATAIKVDLSAS